MSSITDYLDSAILNHAFRGVSFPAPSKVYVGLFTSHPDQGKEVAASDYVRQLIKFSEPEKDARGIFSILNELDINFPKALSFWGRVSHYAIFDAPMGGNGLTPGSFGTAKIVEKDDIFQIGKGKLVVTFPQAAGTS